MAKTINDYYNDADKQTRDQRNKALEGVENSANLSIKQAEDEFNLATDQAKVSYESEYERNAVQKLINEKSIAERNANLGLTDSGLNRTQQTAAQLSYANQKGDIDLARQNAIDTLQLNLASAITNIKKELEANKLAINQTYDQMNMQLATELQNADIAKQQRYSSYGYGGGGGAGSNVDLLTYRRKKGGITYFEDKNGNIIEVETGVNPYTGTKHPNAKYGTFNNGYQPNNVGVYTDGNGEKAVNTLSRTGLTTTFNGKEIAVWQDKTGREWFWDGVNNCYREYFDN